MTALGQIIEALGDDKSQVIFCLTAIAGFAMWKLDPSISSQIVNSIVAGLLGVAVGRGVK